MNPELEAEARLRTGRRRSPTRPPPDPTATLCAVLANPGRLGLLRTLLKGERTAGELAKASGASPSATANRLAELTKAGLVEQRKEGRRSLYRVAHPEAGRALQRLDALAAAAQAATP